MPRTMRILIISAVLFLSAGGGWSGETPGLQDQNIGGRMFHAAKDLIDGLSGEQKAIALLPFSSPGRTDWHYFPREREGLPIGRFSTSQKALLRRLLATCLTETGVEHTYGVIRLEQILFEREKNSRRDPGNYAIVFWGEPSRQDRWGWRFEGHHLSVNVALDGVRVTGITPTFFGANPARVESGPLKGFRNLPNRQDRAFEFLMSLGKELRLQALQEEEPADIEGAGVARSVPPVGKGLKIRNLTPTQKSLFGDLVSAYLDDFQPALLAELECSLDVLLTDPDLEFQWRGGMSPNERHTYRICGNRIDIQFADQHPAMNHIHSVIRFPEHDFGLNR